MSCAAEVEARRIFDLGAIGWAPPPDLSVSEWAQRKRLLPETSAAKGGPWRNDVAPYLVEIMDVCRCARDARNRDVRKVVLMKAGQSGGSSAIENIIGYHVEHDPCNILVVHPTDDAVMEWSSDRLDDLVRNTPSLAARVRDRQPPRGSKHESGSTRKHKVFPGGQLFAGSGKTPNTFARRAARLVIADDFERFPDEVGEEGDPADLLVTRTASYHDGLNVYVSTPALKGGRIDTLFQRSDQRRYHVCCPRCQHEDWIAWSDERRFRVGWDERDAATARLECPQCKAHLREPERRVMVLGGRWLPTAVQLEPGLVGFHLPAMISTLGTVTLGWIVGAFLSAHAKGANSLKTFVNTQLGEGWEERGARIEPHALLARRESYGEGARVPGWACALTAGVDVQLDRLEIQVQAWGRGAERAVVDVRALPGDPKRPEVWASLLEALGERYAHASGHLLPILATCIDSGFLADEVYNFVLAYQGVRRIWATKGFAGRTGEPLVGKASERRTGSKPRAVRVYPVNVDDAKSDVLASVTLTAPGPGYMHLPEFIDEEFLSQLCAEHKETHHSKAGVALKVIWVQDRPRNEALDTAVLCLIAFRLLNPNMQALAASLSVAPAPTSGQAGGSGGGAPPQAPRQQQVEQRVRRSSYLGR